MSSEIEDIADRIFIDKESVEILDSAGDVITTSATTHTECLQTSRCHLLGDFYLQADKGLQSMR